jgi:hypothetical protein
MSNEVVICFFLFFVNFFFKIVFTSQHSQEQLSSLKKAIDAHLKNTDVYSSIRTIIKGFVKDASEVTIMYLLLH